MGLQSRTKRARRTVLAVKARMADPTARGPNDMSPKRDLPLALEALRKELRRAQ